MEAKGGGRHIGAREEDFTVGIVVPQRMAARVRAYEGGKRWCGIAMDGLILLSIRLL